ncbi:lipid asymmetry maintenance protein MlaB [Aeromonas enteropelogenes]|uniref:STAS domain-containing protein n=1 Tax=Aeromonas enteropelogenes TaxID=29489 RepID=UPI001CCBBF85|nr:STAS domain-containing protein [Aeromonas enteropelogenes]UBH26360.1 STAS domain-containing protein [Aeromonas enteropelogenes]
MSFELDILHTPPLATLTGELTIMTLEELQDDLFSMLNFSSSMLDLSQLEMLDGCGAQLIGLLQQEAHQQGKQLQIRLAEESLAQLVLKQLGFLPLLNIAEADDGHQ